MKIWILIRTFEGFNYEREVLAFSSEEEFLKVLSNALDRCFKLSELDIESWKTYCDNPEKPISELTTYDHLAIWQNFMYENSERYDGLSNYHWEVVELDGNVPDDF
jgi:hypothetical protein